MHHSHAHRFGSTQTPRAAGRIHQLRHGVGYYLVEAYTDVVAAKLLRRRFTDQGRATQNLWLQ